MKHIFSISCAAFLSLVLLVTSCKKGDQGPAGPAGPQGDKGTKGDTGVANVIYSTWTDVTFTAVKNQAGDTIYYYGGKIAAPKLTAAILNGGQMMTYVNLGTVGAPFIYPLPWAGNAYIDVEYVVGNINLYSNANAGTSGTGNNKTLQYRYILIPGGVPARSAAIDWNNYAAVIKALGIPE